MEITEIRIKLMEGTEDRLRGFCSITFDHCFVVRDLKIIQGNNGPFVAMPSRKLTSNCPKCRTKNHLRSNFCNHCGTELKNVPLSYDATGRAKLYADIAHPVNAACREKIQNRIVEELKRELELASQPGYRSRYDDDYDDDFDVADYSDLQRTKSKMPHDDELMPGPMHPPKLAPLEETTKRLDLAAPAPPSPHDGLSPNETSDPVANPNQGTDEFGKGIF